MIETKHTNPITESEIRELAKPFMRQCGDHWSCQDAIPDDLIEDFVRAVETKKDQQFILVLNSHADMLAALESFPDTNSFGSYEDYIATLDTWYNQVAKLAIAKAKGGAK